MFNKEINDILNLNNKLLIKNREQTLQGVINILNKNGWTKSNINKYLTKWNNKDSEGKFIPYCGIVIYYLQKRLKQIR